MTKNSCFSYFCVDLGLVTCLLIFRPRKMHIHNIYIYILCFVSTFNPASFLVSASFRCRFYFIFFLSCFSEIWKSDLKDVSGKMYIWTQWIDTRDADQKIFDLWKSLKIVNFFSKYCVIFDVLSSNMLQHQIFFSQQYNTGEENFSRNTGVKHWLDVIYKWGITWRKIYSKWF